MLILTAEDAKDQKIDILINKINTLFQQHDDQTLNNGFHLIAKNLYQVAEKSSIQSSFELLKKSLCYFFSQEFPLFTDMQQLLLHRIQLLPISSDRNIFEDSIVDLLNYSYIQFCYYIKQFSPIIQSGTVRSLWFPQNVHSELECPQLGVSQKAYCPRLGDGAV